MSQPQPQPQPQPQLQLQPLPLRTQDSLIFGVPARDVTSATPRFRWGRLEENVFIDHIQDHLVMEFRFDDMDLLLQRLDLHGFDNIQNSQGENIRTLLQHRVETKIASMRLRSGLGNYPVSDPPQQANADPANQPIPGYNINIIDPDSGDSSDEPLINKRGQRKGKGKTV